MRHQDYRNAFDYRYKQLSGWAERYLSEGNETYYHWAIEVCDGLEQLRQRAITELGSPVVDDERWNTVISLRDQVKERWAADVRSREEARDRRVAEDDRNAAPPSRPQTVGDIIEWDDD
jgi:hypothetical protein